MSASPDPARANAPSFERTKFVTGFGAQPLEKARPAPGPSRWGPDGSRAGSRQGIGCCARS